MNLDEYRALKAQQEAQQEQQEVVENPTETEPTQPEVSETPPTETPEPTPTEPAETTPQEPAPSEPTPEPEPKLPESIEIDGQEVTLEELKNGYMRMSDYTRKTQEAKRLREQAEEALKILEQIQQNPQVAQQLQAYNVNVPDPVQQHIKQLEDSYYDLLIQTQLRELKDQHGEFNEVEVLNIARDEGINNLETAYHVWASRQGGGKSNEVAEVNIDEIKEELRQELLEEIKREQQAQVDTSTVIDSRPPMKDIQTTPQLTPAEMKVAKAMGISPEEYVVWRDGNKKKK